MCKGKNICDNNRNWKSLYQQWVVYNYKNTLLISTQGSSSEMFCYDTNTILCVKQEVVIQTSKESSKSWTMIFEKNVFATMVIKSHRFVQLGVNMALICPTFDILPQYHSPVPLYLTT